MSNALAAETSPYLRQHSENPVDWLPWGPTALTRARELDKPLLVSIGYSSCHWCHVMERESFEDPRTAELMNESFVCVKVDREERPDVDALYMEAVQALTAVKTRQPCWQQRDQVEGLSQRQGGGNRGAGGIVEAFE